MENLKDILVSVRKENRLTQKELADKMFISNKLISKWECGRGVPSDEYLEEYANIFNISLEKLKNLARLELKKEKSYLGENSILMCIFLIISFIPFSVSVISDCFLPKKIPIHFNSINEITRYSNKFELLICGIILSAICIIFVYIFKIIIKKNEDTFDNKNLLISILSLYILPIMFSFLQIYITIKISKHCEINSTNYINITFTCMYLLFIFLGIVCMFVPRNSIFGFRVNKTMSDPVIWKKANVFSGRIFIVSGVIASIVSLHISFTYQIIMALLVITLDLIVSYLYLNKL